MRVRLKPDFVTPPGEILEEELEQLGRSQAGLATRIGRTTKTVNEIIKAIAPLLPKPLRGDDDDQK